VHVHPERAALQYNRIGHYKPQVRQEDHKHRNGPQNIEIGSQVTPEAPALFDYR
jgi:hypothetical protein